MGYGQLNEDIKQIPMKEVGNKNNIKGEKDYE